MRISKKYRLTAAAMLAASSVVTVAPGLSHANSMYKDVSPSASYARRIKLTLSKDVTRGATVTYSCLMCTVTAVNLNRLNDYFIQFWRNKKTRDCPISPK